MNIGQKIKKQRELAKLSQGDITNLCGYSQSRISGYETGARIPDIVDVEVLADAIGCSRATLFLDEVETNPPLERITKKIRDFDDREYQRLDDQIDVIIMDRNRTTLIEIKKNPPQR